MRILILSANTGEGHNSAARALKEYIEAQGSSCEIEDGLNYIGKSSNKLICKSHIFLYRSLPKVYGAGYRFEEEQSRRKNYQQVLSAQVRRNRWRKLPRCKRSLRALLCSGNYDAVICTHVFAARLVSELRLSGEVDLPAFFLATDYTCSPGVNQLDADAWLIPHPRLIPEFASYGIPEAKLIPSGIPVRRVFLERKDPLQARRELNLPEGRPIAVISCGSMGAGQMGRMVSVLVKAIPEDALLVATSGRYEYKNKGIDVFIESMKRLSERAELNREVVAFVVVPAYISGPRQDLLQAIHEGTHCNSWNRVTTHELHEYGSDSVMGALRWFHFNNAKDDKVKVIFVPSYIDLRDPIFNCSYYDLLIGFDLTVFPSYYEPWGYTPLESVAFHIPTITTSLSGFGQWAKEYADNINGGVEVVKRSDYNTYEVVTKIADTVLHYAAMNAKTVAVARKAAAGVAEKALWKRFMPFYNQAYTIALLNNAEKNKH